MNSGLLKVMASAVGASLCLASVAGCDAREAQPPCDPAGADGRPGASDGSSMLTLSDEDLDRVLDAAGDAGMWSLRIDIDWSLVEPSPGERDWAIPDRIVKAVAARGMCPLGLLAYAPAWAAVEHPGPLDSRFEPRNPAEFADFAGAAALRYRNEITVWEVWNEPNNADFYKPTPDVESYGALLSASYRAIKAADPGATVLSGGLSPAEDDGRHIAPVTFLAGLYRGGYNRFFDAFAIHPYSYPELPDAPDTSHWNTAQKMTSMRAEMARGGDEDKSIWITEFGAPTGTGDDAVTDPVQARTIEIMLGWARDTPWIAAAFVYSIRDSGIDVAEIEQNFGLLRHDFSAKPSFEVARRFGHSEPDG